MTVAYLGLGANLGDARQSLKDAVVCLAQQHAITVLAKSSLYRTAPIDASGDDYYNLVVKLETSMSAPALLALCHRIEHHFGRERPFRNAPRTLDLDIVLYGDGHVDEPDLVIPHPRAFERAFVLVPLIEIDPDISIPGQGRADALLERVAHQRIEKVKTCRCAVADALASAAAKLSGGCGQARKGDRSSEAAASPDASGTTHGGKP